MAETGESLSERELDVLAYIVQGASNKEIAARLFISENTVKVHLRRIFAKLGVSSRTEATTLALQKGLVVMPGLEAAASSPVSVQVSSEAGAAAGLASPGPEPATEDAGPGGEMAVSQLSRRFSWRSFSLGLALFAIAILLGLLIWQQQNAAAPAIQGDNATPFAEQPLGDSRWLLSRAMPGELAAMAVAAVGLDIYLIGGEDQQGTVNQVRVYDTIQYQWQEGAPKPTAVSQTTAAVLFGEIYVPGGLGANGAPTGIVEVYSPANKLWRTIAPLPKALSGGLALVQGGRLYLFGGWDGAAYLDTAYAYDPALDSWQSLPPMSHPRALTTGGVIGNDLYVVGGYDGLAELNACATFDVTAETWQECPPLLQPRAGAGAVVLLNKLYVLGGGLSPGSGILFGEEFNPATQTWHMIETPMIQEAGNWFAPGISNVETRIYAFGGRRGEALLADTYVLRAVFQTFLPAFPTQP